MASLDWDLFKIYAAVATFLLMISIMLGLILEWLYRKSQFIYHRYYLKDYAKAIRTLKAGYSTVKGIAKSIDGKAILSPLTKTPCVWYEYRVINWRRHSYWGQGFRHPDFITRNVESFQSYLALLQLKRFFHVYKGNYNINETLEHRITEDGFYLEDATGRVVVSPKDLDFVDTFDTKQCKYLKTPGETWQDLLTDSAERRIFDLG